MSGHLMVISRIVGTLRLMIGEDHDAFHKPLASDFDCRIEVHDLKRLAWLKTIQFNGREVRVGSFR